MTLIARAHFGALPIYWGDMLLSSERDSGRPVRIPAADDINALLPSKRSRWVSGMTQKLNIIGDRLIVSWAGDLTQARAIIRDFSHLGNKNKLSLEDIFRTLGSIPERDRNDMVLLGSLCTPEIEHNRVRIDNFSYGIDKEILGGRDVYISGTGKRVFQSTFEQSLKNFGTLNHPKEGVLPFAVFGQVVAAQFIGTEMMTGQNIIEWFGGGFEVATCDNGKFIKIGNVLNTFWERNISNRDEIVDLMFTFIKYDYHDDALAIQKYELDVENDGKAIVKTHAYNVYLPMLKNMRDYDFSLFPQFDLDYKILNCFIFVKNGEQAVATVVISIHGEKPIMINRLDGKIEVGLDQKLFTNIIEMTNKFLK